MTDQELKPDEARAALDTIAEKQRASFRRAVLPRWYSAGLALIVAVGFSLYALEQPGNTPALFIVLGLALFIGASRNRIAAYGKELPDTRIGALALLAVCVFLLALFFGGIIARRAYDIAWLPVLTGCIAGATIFLLGESERRYNLMRSAEAPD